MSRPGRPRVRASSYTTLFELARGGMGVVELAVLASDRFLRLYAVKRLLPYMAEDAAVRAMFLEEGRLAGLLRHPNVVSVLDVASDGHGPFLVMEYVEGVPASRLIERAGQGDKHLGTQLCARIIGQAARGLHAAHELTDSDGRALGLIHRDVSPQNILVGFDGSVRVTDFGVAKALDSLARTHTGTLKGKMGYMAPERLRYEAFDRRADIFALGVVFYELLAGTRLYDDLDGVAVARKILYGPPADIGLVRDDVPARLEELLLRMLARDPALRPATALEVAQALEGWIAEAAADEGVLDLGGFLSDLFADEREAAAQRVKSALAATRQRGSPASRRVLAVAAAMAVPAASVWGLGLWSRRRALQRYPLGHVWRRADQWRPGTPTAGNPGQDDRGEPVWAYEFAVGGGALDEAAPWFASPRRRLEWDPRFFRDGPAWARGDDLNPNVTREYLVHASAGESGAFAPIVRWANPVGRPVALDIRGELATIYKTRDGSNGELDIALVRVGRNADVIWSRRETSGARGVTLRLDLFAQRLDGGEGLVLTVRGRGDFDFVTLVDRDLRYTLVELA